jgi:membrane-associated phospholipid phosphatase
MLYGYGMALTWKHGNMEKWKHWMQYKISAVFIFCGTVLSFLANIFVQFFVDKVRPNVVLWLADLKHETILNGLMPSSSFPSGHAVVSMSIAFASIARWVKNKDKKYFRFGGVLIIFSLITSLSRVTTAVHRPTDVIAGSVIGIIVPWVLTNKKIYGLIECLGRWIGKII